VFQLVASVSPTPTPSPTPSSSPTPTPSPTATPTPVQVQGALTISPASLTFPNQIFGGGAVGATSHPKPITVTNPKKKTEPAITIESLTPTPNDANGIYTVLPTGTCTVGEVLASGAKCTVNVVYTPTTNAKSTGSLAVNNNGTKPALTTKLAGTGVLGSISATPGSLSFGKVAVGTPVTKPVTITNKNGAVMTISQVIFSGKFPGDYSETDTCKPSIARTSTCTVQVTFTPQATGSRAGILEISGTLKTSPLKVNLSGTGQ